jgi:hypothetical protein
VFVANYKPGGRLMWFLVRMVFWLTVVSILLGRAPLSWLGGVERTASLSDKRIPSSQSTLTPADLAATWREPVRAGELLHEVKQRARPHVALRSGDSTRAPASKMHAASTSESRSTPEVKQLGRNE